MVTTSDLLLSLESGSVPTRGKQLTSTPRSRTVRAKVCVQGWRAVSGMLLCICVWLSCTSVHMWFFDTTCVTVFIVSPHSCLHAQA